MNPDWITAGLSVATILIVVGGYVMIIKEHGKELEELKTLHNEMRKENDAAHRLIDAHDALQDVALAKLQSWQEGFNAARAFFFDQRSTKHQTTNP